MRAAPLLLCSLPVFLDLFYGNLNGFFVLAGAGFLQLRKRPFLAGLCLSLWILKPQNLLVLGLGFIHGPRVRLGMLTGVAALLAVRQDLPFYPDSSANWGLLRQHLLFGYSRTADIPVAVGVVLTVVAIGKLWRLRPSPERLYLGTLAGSLCLSGDTSLALLPALIQAPFLAWTVLPALAFVVPAFLFPTSPLSHQLAAALLLAGNVGWLAWTLRGTTLLGSARRDALLLFAGLLAAQAWVNLPQPEHELLRFGWEYGNIGAALAQGKGFADAMGPGSGPTAWMPPLLPVLYGLIFGLCGAHTLAAAAALSVLKSAGLALAFYWQRGLLPERKGVLTAAWLCYLLLDRQWILTDLLDPWLTVLLSSLALRAMASPGWALPGVTAFLLALGCPPLAAGYALIWAVRAARKRPRLRAIVLCGCVLLAGELWTTRNALVLGRAYPIKSNLTYDFVQAQTIDDDGVLTHSTMYVAHPCNPGSRHHALYVKAGEVDFLDQFHAVAPPDFGTRIARRLANAFVFLRRADDIAGVKDTLSAQDEALLRQRGVFGADEYGTPLWLFLEEPPESFAQRADAWPFEDRNAVMHSRWEAAALYAERTHSAEAWAFGLAHALLPTLAIVWGLGKRQRHPLFLEGVALYLVYLTPYLIVSHYDRYQTAAFALQAWVVVLGTARQRQTLDGTAVAD